MPAPIVLDAEALRSMATMDGWWEGDRRPAVLTPHAGEFARLRAGSGDQAADDGDLDGDDEARLAAAVDAAATWGSVVVLKGARTIIAAPDGSAAIAPFENPALATGGTGDVLAGAIGVAPRPGPRAVRCGAPRASTSTARPATPAASGSATPGCSPRTCPTASRWPASALRPRPSAGPPPSGSVSRRATPAGARRARIARAGVATGIPGDLR